MRHGIGVPVTASPVVRAVTSTSGVASVGESRATRACTSRAPERRAAGIAPLGRRAESFVRLTCAATSTPPHAVRHDETASGPAGPISIVDARTSSEPTSPSLALTWPDARRSFSVASTWALASLHPPNEPCVRSRTMRPSAERGRTVASTSSATRPPRCSRPARRPTRARSRPWLFAVTRREPGDAWTDASSRAPTPSTSRSSTPIAPPAMRTAPARALAVSPLRRSSTRRSVSDTPCTRPRSALAATSAPWPCSATSTAARDGGPWAAAVRRSNFSVPSRSAPPARSASIDGASSGPCARAVSLTASSHADPAPTPAAEATRRASTCFAPRSTDPRAVASALPCAARAIRGTASRLGTRADASKESSSERPFGASRRVAVSGAPGS